MVLTVSREWGVPVRIVQGWPITSVMERFEFIHMEREAEIDRMAAAIGKALRSLPGGSRA